MSTTETIVILLLFLFIVGFLLWARHGAKKWYKWFKAQPKEYQDKWLKEWNKRGEEEGN